MSETESPEFEGDEEIIQTRDEDDQAAAEPADVDWGEVWAIANAEPGQALSRTQASLCVQVSEQCPPRSHDPASEYVERAIDAGPLKEVKHGKLFVSGGDV